MAIDRGFGRSLSNKLMNEVFAGARRNIEITKTGTFDPINEVSSGDELFTGKCIRVSLDKKSYENQMIQDADFIVKVRASEVNFAVRQDNCTMKLQKLSPVNDADLGLVDCAILDVSLDALDAVYTIAGKYV